MDKAKTAAKAAWAFLFATLAVALEAAVAALATPETLGQVLSGRGWKAALIPVAVASLAAVRDWLKHRHDGPVVSLPR